MSESPHAIYGAALRIAHTESRTTVLGPGVRSVIWFQGCLLNCPNCIAQEMNIAAPAFLTTPRNLADWCMSQLGIQGVTLSGGDPLDQPLGMLEEFLSILRLETSLDIVLYTGRTLSQLRQIDVGPMARVLELVDILIDGPYLETLNNGHGWRGSSNQQIHWLSNRLTPDNSPEPAQRKMRISLNQQGELSLVGIPAKRRAHEFTQNLLQAAVGGNLSGKS